MQSNWQNIIELFGQYKNAKWEYWLNETLFNSNWWILFVTTAGIFIVWVIILDKKRFFEIVTYGFMVTTIALLGDTIGLWLSLWAYPDSLTPVPEILEIHTAQMPIIYMIIYQCFSKWRTFLIVAAINAIVFAFILEPTLVSLEIYELYQWKYIYSVVPYFIIAVALKWIVNKIKKAAQD